MSRSPQPKPKPTKKKEPEQAPVSRRRVQWQFLVGAGTLVVILAAATVYSFYYQERYLPHTQVGGQSIGGLTRDEAVLALMERRDAFLDTKLSIEAEGETWETTARELGSEVAFDSALESEFQAEHTGTWYQVLGKMLTGPFTRRARAVTITPYSDAGLAVARDHVFKKVEKPFQETTLAITPGGVTVVPGVAGEGLNEQAFSQAIVAAFEDNITTIRTLLEPAQPKVTTEEAEAARQRATFFMQAPLSVTLASDTKTVDAATLASWIGTESNALGTGLRFVLNGREQEVVQAWKGELDRKPVNARLGLDGSGKATVVDSDKPGREVNYDATITALAEYMNGTSQAHTVAGVVQAAQAEVRADTLASLGLVELVGTATTDFTGSPNNRKFNISKGAASLDRQLVQAGATFSTTGTLGPIEESTGYLPELVIKGTRTVPEAGGGLCQVSTTLFRSVLNAGLPITERTNHAYRVSYYEVGVGPGLDATIYDPSPDFKWKNDFGSAVFVQSYIKGNKLTYELYGTKDGRVSTISSPTILETYPVGQPIYSETDTLLKGETKQIERAHDGAKTSVTYTVMRGGQEIYKKVFLSKYKAWPAQYLVGTREPAPGEQPAA